MPSDKGSVRVKLVEEYEEIEEMQEAMNAALKELKDYYVIDIKPIGDFIGIMYFSKKKQD